MTRPIDIAKRLCPRAKSSYLAALEEGDGLFHDHGITTPLRLSHFLAQAFHESGGLSIERESGNYSAPRIVQIFGVGHHSAAVTESEARQLAGDGPALFDRVYGLGNPKKAAELGNTQPGDGWRYRGNGILQTTGRGNHRRMGQKCGVDFEGRPELVTSAQHALKPALAEWSEGDLNAAADRDDIETITRKINGGENGLDQRRDWLRKIKPLVQTVDLKIAPTPPDVEPVPTPVPKPTKQVATGSAGAATGAALHILGLPLWAVLSAAFVVALVVYLIIRSKK